jgi:hypothetical protein
MCYWLGKFKGKILMKKCQKCEEIQQELEMILWEQFGLYTTRRRLKNEN